MFAGLETIAIESAVKALGGMAVSTLKELGNVNVDTPLQQTLFNVSRRYIRRYLERHGNLKILGMSQPVPLKDVYTAVRILDARELRRFETLEDLEEQYRESGQRGFGQRKCETQAGIDAANEQQYLMVLGGPGIGKSTYLRKMGLEALLRQKDGYEHAVTPIFLELKGFDSEELDIEAKIAKEFETCGFPSATAFQAPCV
ncbi:MAG: hypothetical protein AAFY11_05780 [Cyanobacteria bacterium J06641_5]